MNNIRGKLVFLITNFTKKYIAIFYDDCVIFALIDKKIYKQLNKNIKNQIKEQKIPLLQRNDYYKTKRNDFANSYLMKSHESVICENGNNFELMYSDIEAVKLSPYKNHTTREYEDGKVAGQLWINTHNKKYHFNHEYEKHHIKVNEIKELFVDRFVLLK